MTTSNTLASLVERLTAENKKLRAEIVELRKEIADWSQK